MLSLQTQISFFFGHSINVDIANVMGKKIEGTDGHGEDRIQRMEKEGTADWEVKEVEHGCGCKVGNSNAASCEKFGFHSHWIGLAVTCFQGEGSLGIYSRETSRPNSLALSQSKATRIRLRAVLKRISIGSKQIAVVPVSKKGCNSAVKRDTYC